MRGSRFGNGLGIGFRAGFEVTLGPKCKAKCLELDSAPRLRSIPRSPNVLSDLGPSLGQEFETRGVWGRSSKPEFLPSPAGCNHLSQGLVRIRESNLGIIKKNV